MGAGRRERRARRRAKDDEKFLRDWDREFSNLTTIALGLVLGLAVVWATVVWRYTVGYAFPLFSSSYLALALYIAAISVVDVGVVIVCTKGIVIVGHFVRRRWVVFDLQRLRELAEERRVS